MAVLDAKLEMSDAQALDSLDDSPVISSTNVIDFGTHKNTWGTAITPDIGEGGAMQWNLKINEVFVGASAVVTAELITGTAVASGAITSGATTIASVTIPALSAVGTSWTRYVPPGTVSRYVYTKYTGTNGSALTTGDVDSYLSLDHENID